MDETDTRTSVMKIFSACPTGGAGDKRLQVRLLHLCITLSYLHQLYRSLIRHCIAMCFLIQTVLCCNVLHN